MVSATYSDSYKASDLLEHCKTLALIMLSWAQTLAGMSLPILQFPSGKMPHLDPMTWILSVCTFVDLHNLSLYTNAIQIPSLQREGDWFLMDIALQLCNDATRIQAINACRIPLGALMCSDITHPNGHQIYTAALTGGTLP